MRRLVLVMAVVALVLGTLPAQAQELQLQRFALNRFEPAPVGDRFFAVPGADQAGHLNLRAGLLGDYAYRPLRIEWDQGDDERRGDIVSDHLFLHVGVGLSLWDRVNVSLNAPFALLTSGDSPVAGGFRYVSPEGAAVGDLRANLRVRLVGAPRGIAQLSLGGSFWFPTGDRKSYAGDGRPRARPEVTLSGENDHFTYAVNAGVNLRRQRVVLNDSIDDELAFGVGIALLAADRKLQIGPELYGTTKLEDPFKRISTNAEAILGIKYRVGPVVLGAGAGPGLTKAGLGTPTLRALLSVAYAPIPEPPPPVKTDRDKDGIWDEDDACPDTFGISASEPNRNGCPDQDKDGIFDQDDACVDVKGVADEDPKKNGCPPDRDEDGILDADDACVDVKGVANEDPKKNGCPPDRDEDGIVDGEDACPDIQGVKTSDPETNGCPPDTDGDGIRDDRDACPKEKGKADPDPKKNGCPSLVRVTEKEIVILQQVQFKTASDVILKASDELLEQVSAVLREHPEIKLIEIQGHTDNRGNANYNQKLSERRAKSVVKWLTQRGSIDAERVDARGYGMDQPVAENTTDEGRQLNRRVQFKIVTMNKPKKPSEE